MVVAIVGISLTAMTIPALVKLQRNFRTAGDARALNGAVSMAKMRAAADFTQSRLYADLAANSFHIETWNKSTSAWTTEGGTQPLSTGNTFGYGSLSTPPANTQTTMGQASACRNNANTSNISNTACLIFNSRGIPVDSTGAPTGQDALYATDGNSVFGVTIAPTGLLRLWRSDSTTASWSQR
jgi:hypothetical protein